MTPPDPRLTQPATVGAASLSAPLVAAHPAAKRSRAPATAAIETSGDDAPSRPSTPKLGNVQALRAIAVLMVVAVHVGNPYGFEARYLGGSSLLGWVNLPGQMGVDLFFVISGLIMTITTWNAACGTSGARRFMLRRVRRIYPIYWVVSLLVLAVYLTRPELVNSHSAHAPEILQSFILLPQPGLPLLAVGWTLTFEMYFYLVFAVALLAGRSRMPWILGTWGAITLVLALIVGENSSVPALKLLADPLLLEFLLGVGIGHLVMTRPPVAPGWLLAGGIALSAVAVSFAGAINHTMLDPWFRTIAIGPPAAMIVLGAIGLERQRRYVAAPFLQYIGDASYSIYLWHTLLLVAVGRVVTMLLPSPGALHVVLLVVVPLAVLATCMVLYERVERPLLKLVGQKTTPRPRRATA